MGEVLETTKALVEPAMKLIDVVQSAIGKAYEPTHIKKMADAKAYEIAKVSSAIREASDIPILYDKGELSLDTTDFDEFLKRTQNRLAYQECKKQHNIETVSNKAYEMVEGTEKVPAVPVDSDWIDRFFDYVGDISNEKMQELWSSILAGEVKRPSSFSLRTLETLHNISQSEAELFQRISPYLIHEQNKAFLPNYLSLLDTVSIDYSDLLRLDECGLINSSSSIQVNIPVRQKRQLIDNSSYVLIGNTKGNEEAIVSISSYPLTAVGFEIVKLFNTHTDDAFFISLSTEIKKGNPNVDIKLFKIIEKNSDYITYSQNQPIDI